MNENLNKQDREQIVELGSDITKSKKGSIYTLTIIGQVEGHQVAPETVKTTKYEHVLPLLAGIEESDDIDGLLLLLNTVGGDIEAGLAIAEMIAGMKKPTVVGTSKIRIKYAFQPKDIHDPESWIDCGQLLADKGLTLYTSYFVAQNDSALRAWLKANPNKSYYPNGLCLHGRESASWTEYQYGYFYVHGNELTEWAIMPSPETAHYRYTESWPSMQWTLGTEK